MILVPFVNNLVGLLLKIAQHEVGQLLGIPEEINKLTSLLRTIQCVLADAERRQIQSEAIRKWIMELNDVMYDADDIIDLCQIKAEQRRARSGSSSNSDSSSGIHLHSCFRNPVFARKVARKIRKLNSRVDVIVKNISLLGLTEVRNFPVEVRPVAIDLDRINHPILDLSGLVGEQIENSSRMLVELLIKEQTFVRENVLVVAIVGMGGIGKTTLAKKVYNDPKIQEEFKTIWTCVSEQHRPIDILKAVIRGLDGGYGADQDIPELVAVLAQLVQGKKIFLVLDDIWPQSEKVWHCLLRDPMIKGAFGSKVLITTRDGGVAHRMKAIQSHCVNKLSDDDGWSLLVKQVVLNGLESEIQDLKDIGLQIVKRCDGLPLAIKTIGGVLCTKSRTRGEWEKVLESNLWSLEGKPTDIHKAFFLSYEDLPWPLKQCFIYFSIYPEEFVFYRSPLIYHWLAEGILQDTGDLSFYELGNEYYDELILRNFLEPYGRNFDRPICKMHDLLWSFARYLGQHENCILKEGDVSHRLDSSLKIRRLSIEGNVVNTGVIKREKSLRTLSLRYKPKIIFSGVFEALSKLQILDLGGSGISSIPASLCNLVHLRYLDVSNSRIRVLPNSIGNLKNLVFLNLAFCRELWNIPPSITNLVELKFLSLHETKVDLIPAGLKKLKKLVGLFGIIPCDYNLLAFSSLEDLETLSQLVEIQILSLEKSSDINRAEKANIQGKIHLKRLRIFYSQLHREDQVGKTNAENTNLESVLNALSPPPSIELLTIQHYYGCCLPAWLSMGVEFPNLRTIELRDCACFKKLGPLGRFPNLEFIWIEAANSVVHIGKEFFCCDSAGNSTKNVNCLPAFPKLKELHFQQMFNWLEWQWEKGALAMPELRKLFIKYCPRLISLPEGLLHRVNTLESIHIRGTNLKVVENLLSVRDIYVIKNSSLERISNMPSLSYILIRDCPSLIALENFKALERMDFMDLNMETLPNYLVMIIPEKLTIRCSEKLLLKITKQGVGGLEWLKFAHIAKVKIYTEDESLYAIYQKTPFSFSTNVSDETKVVGSYSGTVSTNLILP